MPLFSDHISNMYYSGSSAYTSSPYSYSSAASPFGSSYSASYLNPGGSYSSHSSLGGYSRAPLSSRWLTSGGRAYSPMLSPISEKGTSSPVRINSPRRIPISGRSYVPSTYTSRPININTADIDVSRDKYRKKLLSSNSTTPTGLPPRRESPLTNKENGHDKPDTGIDTSPGPRRSTIKRDRAVVRLHTVKRKERDSPRKPLEAPNKATNNDSPKTENQTESKKWREKLADDLAYKTQKETKSLGAKLVEKFTLKEKVDDEHDNCTKISPKTHIDDEKSSVQLNNDDVITFPNKSVDRRCSMELLAEQASLLDSLIRRENLSTASLDLSKVGANDNLTTDINLEPKDTKIRKLSHQENRLTTTQSDHSLHDLLASKDNKEQIFSKRRSLRKCSSGDNIRKLDCIKEIPKKAKALNLLPAEEKIDINKILKPKIKTKITSSVEVTSTTPQLKFFVENVTVEETSRPCKKDIIFSSRVDENPLNEISIEIEGRRKSVKLKKQVKPQADIQVDTSMKKVDHNNGKDKNLPNVNLQTTKGHRKSIKSKIKDKSTPLEDTGNLTSPEPEDGNFWEKIGKRETIYLIQRKQNLEEAKERSKRSLFWFPEEETCDIDTEKNEILDKPLFKEVTNANCVETIKEAKKICTQRKENEIINAPINKLEEKINTKIDIHDKKLTNTSTVKDINYSEVIENTSSSSHVKTNENILNDKKVVATPDLIKSEKSNLNMRMCKTSKSEKNSENDNTCINNLRDINNQYAEDIEKSKVVLNKNTAEDTKSVTKSKDGKKSNIGNQNKSLNKENLSKNQNISVPQANSMNDLKEILSINKTSKSGENNKKENNYVNNSKDINNQGIEFTEDMEKSKVTLNKGISEDTKNITKSKDSKKSNIDERKKSLNKEQSIENQNVIIPEANLIDHLKETSSISNGKESNNISSTSQPNLTQDLITIEQKHVISSDIGHETNLKDEFEKVRTIPIENNAELSPDTAIIDVSKNNIPEKKTIKFPINKSSKETDENNGITEIFEIKAEQPDVVSTSSNSPKEASVIIENTDMENKKDGKVEAAKTDDKIKNSNLLVDQDNKIQLKESDINIEEKSTSNSQIQKNETTETKTKPEITDKPVSSTDALQVFSNKKPAKEEKALKTLIATPRPLQKRNPQTIRSSSSSSESSDDDSSEDTEEDGHEDQGESGSSHGSAEYRECENNPDGRTSTGSADSGFDSSAPTSPSGFLHAKKEHSTAYDLFRKTGRFTPPARTIPRFRKYTIEDFQFIRVLGKGSFGKVMLAELRGTEYYYAVKCLKKDVVLEDDDVECTLIERKVLALGTNHPYLCHLFATFQTDSHLFFVMEYLNGGDLMFHIQQSGRFPEVRARFYAAEIVSGLKFLHKRGIVYRDLKLDNILLDFDGHVRIADFGMCKLQIYLDKTADTFCGTPDYMAPEIIKGLKYNQTVDWWSFGVLLYEMLIGQSPFSGCDEDELFWSICNEMPSYPRFLSPESLSILTRLLDKDAKTRLGGPECMHGDIRDQKFFEQIQWDRLERRELEAPFKPRVRHPMDTQYFDRAFTGERPRLTAVEPQVLRSMDQEPFRGFSYTNPNATDR